MKEFFTIPDPDLTQESSVDPMGIQVIWTSYGQAIFEEKLTTIANDLRVFTFNLFHHHLLNRLYLDYTEEIQQAKSYYKTWETELDVKAGLLMFLEDLVTHVFIENDYTESSIEKLGILGMSKARILYNSEIPEKIYLSAQKRQGLLKNQLNLGMTGRYKGPMIKMQFFDRSFTYIPKTWEQVNKFMVNWQEAIELENNLIKLITKHLLVSGNKEYPRLSIQELKSLKLWKAVSEGYLQSFGSRKLPKVIRDYWKDRLGLNSGAPLALYIEISKHNPKEQIYHQQIFFNAQKHLNKEPSELKKIENVLALEPFLSHAEYLLRYLSQSSIKLLKEEEKTIELLRKEIVAAADFSLTDIQQRLKDLYAVMTFKGTTTDWLAGILAYHKKVMEQREGNCWIELDEKGTIKHLFSPVLSEKYNTIPKYLKEKPWWHTYYLETLQSIYLGLN